MRLAIPAGAFLKATQFQRNLRRYDKEKARLPCKRPSFFCNLVDFTAPSAGSGHAHLHGQKEQKEASPSSLLCAEHSDELEEWLEHSWCLRVSIRSITLHTASVKASHSLQCSTVSAQALHACKSAYSEPSRPTNIAIHSECCSCPHPFAMAERWQGKTLASMSVYILTRTALAALPALQLSSLTGALWLYP